MNENTNDPVKDTIIENEKVEERNIKIKSNILDDLTCIIYFKENKWNAQLEYKLRPLPSEFSKEPIYNSSGIRDKLTEILILDSATNKAIENLVKNEQYRLSQN